MCAMSRERPTFLISIVDQMRADHMGCDGNPVIKTPHLDGLAAGGVYFSRACVNCPLCMPRRATPDALAPRPAPCCRPGLKHRGVRLPLAPREPATGKVDS